MHHKYPAQIRHLSRLMLERDMDSDMRQNLFRFKKIVWGAGESGKTFVSLNFDIGFEYIVDTRKHLQGKKHENLLICSEEKLFLEDANQTLVFLPNVIHEEIKQKLLEKGFKHVFVPAQLNPSRIVLKIRKKDVEAFVEWINKQDFKYVCRSLMNESTKLTNLSHIDLLIQSDHIHDLLKCPFITSEEDTDILSIDVVWSTPIGLSQELPYFTKTLSDCLLNKEKQTIKHGIPCASPKLLLYVYLYDIILRSGNEDAIRKVSEELTFLEKALDVAIPRSLVDIYQYVQKSDFPIPVDFARKWAEKANSSFFKQLLQIKPLEEQKLAVFIFREFFKDKDALLKQCISMIEKHGFIVTKYQILTGKRLENTISNIRGGVWIDSNFSSIGGQPYSLLICTHSGVSSREAKFAIRDFVSKEFGREINCLHSSDDDLEAMQFIKHIES